MNLRLPDRLAIRIPVALMAVQVIFIMLAMLAFPLLAPFTSYGRIADLTARHLIVRSIVAEGDGTLRIVPTQALRRYTASHPGFSYAVAEPGGSIVKGSMPAIAPLLTHLSPYVSTPAGDSLEILPTGRLAPPAYVTTQRTRVGPITIATSGDVFGLGDMVSFVEFFLPAVLPAYVPVLIGSLIVLPLLLARMLRPLRDVARIARLINFRSLDQRLPAADLPGELRPTVAAINAALDRLADGWSRQRLFTANAAHELRTPVAILQARIDAMAPHAADRDALARDARRLRLLVDQLLSIARLDHRHGSLDGTVDLVGSVRALVADCAPLALRSGRAVAFHAASPHVVVRGDALAIEGAVSNLIDNALRAEPEGGVVDIVVTNDHGGVIDVRDHGEGVPPDDRPLIFEPFWRKDETSRGTGLGLAAVREVMRLHGGTIIVDQTQGGGATFRMEFPLVGLA